MFMNVKEFTPAAMIKIAVTSVHLPSPQQI